MLDHFSFFVSSSRYNEIVEWYLAALAPLGYTTQQDIPGRACGLGPSPHEARFWIGVNDDITHTGLHIAFTAKNHETVSKFYEAAVKAGGKDNGKPGPRAYHPSYYAAFVLDPLGNNIEVVDHMPH